MQSMLAKILLAIDISILVIGFNIAHTNTLWKLLLPQTALAQTTQMNYTFSSAGTLYEANTPEESTSPYFWLDTGAKLLISGGTGSTIQGSVPAGDRWRTLYSKTLPVVSDNGEHPQNIFKLFTKMTLKNVSTSIYLNRKASNLESGVNRNPYNGQSLLIRYVDANTFYLGGIREDGSVVIKKRVNGAYTTLATKKIFPGTYNESTQYNLIPLSKWIGLKLVSADTDSGPRLTLYTDIGRSGAWKQELSVIDDPRDFGASIVKSGYIGFESDFADVQIDDFAVSDVSAPATVTIPPSNTSQSYDSIVLSDKPVLYLAMSGSGSETDKTGNGHNGTYYGTLGSSKMPNGDTVAVFDGVSDYVRVPSSNSFSIPTTKKLTWEAWIRPDTLQFPSATADGYIDWMGKCEEYSPSCEWEARMYTAQNISGRSSRISSYAFNPSAGLGSGADWQPQSGIIEAGKWLHVVAQYDLSTTPSGCSTSQPGQIHIWVNGIPWNMSKHMPTGCMSQYGISPKSGSSALMIGTMAKDTWFKGAIGKVAIYDRLLSSNEIVEHYKTMTGKQPSGSCGETCTSTY